MAFKQPSGLISDVNVPLPEEDVERSSGLAFDIGSTIGKIIYRSNKEYKNRKPIQGQTEKTGNVHFAMFPRNDVAGMIKYVQENCDLTANEEGQIIVNSAGVGGAGFKKDIEAGLNCKLVVLSETDLFCKAFLALEKVLPEEDFMEREPPEIAEHIKQATEQFGHLMEKSQSMSETALHTVSNVAEIKEEDRPRILMMAGSGTGLMQINKDETFSLLSTVFVGGRFMYGLSSALTGENDFSKLEKMASEADGRTVDIWLSDLKSSNVSDASEADNVYDLGDEVAQDWHVFPFGKGVNVPLDDMKKEDRVWSIFNAVAVIHGSACTSNVQVSNARKVYVCGNLFNNKTMRKFLMNHKLQSVFMTAPAYHHLEYARDDQRKFQMTLDNTEHFVRNGSFITTEHRFEYFFLKNGGMYGAMGAYLHVKGPSSAKTNQPQSV